MQNHRKIIIQLLIFITLLIVTFYMLLKDLNIKTLYSIIQNIHPGYLTIGLLGGITYVLCETTAFKLIFKQLNIKVKFYRLIRYSFIGFYFSAITPSATGGQPAQVYYMNKNQIPVSKSTLTILLCVFCYQSSLILTFLFSFIYQYPLLYENISKIKWLLIITGLVNVTIWLVFVGMLFSKKLLPNIINSIFKFLHKIKIIKNLDSKLAKIHHTMEDYHQCALIVKQNKTLLLKVMCIYIFQLIVRFSISFFAARALNITNGSFIQFITVQSIILFCVSSFPLPGGIGVSETLYITLFTTLIPYEKMNIAAIVTQMMNYYFLVVLATFFVLYSYIKYQRK